MYSCVLISGSWNRGVPLCTVVSSFQGVRIEVPSFQGDVLVYHITMSLATSYRYRLTGGFYCVYIL